ncbi:Hypothetical predicted protein [Podarcis lilfordi]|uniref:Uncharacterized protein n=1 Tax=Podarcis lilfordi TaxID=74358 RepID=A0AA35NUP6_9SAUR|nr:Hypothetical predicted protein [Podarcis lilfordi]
MRVMRDPSTGRSSPKTEEIPMSKHGSLNSNIWNAGELSAAEDLIKGPRITCKCVPEGPLAFQLLRRETRDLERR